MSAALDEHPAISPTTTPAVERVAIREVREMAFRTIVAAGASSAEAKAAAEQVLFAELHRGSGLSALLEDVSSGPWRRTGLACERTDLEGRTVAHISGPSRPGALRQGVLLVDLLVAEPGSLVVSDGLTSLTPLLDEPLIRGAQAAGCWLVAVDQTMSSLDFRVAAPDGAIGVGTSSSMNRLSPDPGTLPAGVSLVRFEEPPAPAVTWLTADVQRARRAAAALHGCRVDAAVWAGVTAAASAYLVPEQ